MNRFRYTFSLFCASFFIFGLFADVNAEDIVVSADMNTSSSVIQGTSTNYKTADGDTNYYTFTVNPNVDFNVSKYTGVLSGNLNLVVGGSAGNALTLSAAQSYTGTTTVTSGYFVFAGNATLGTGNVYLNGGAFHTGDYSSGTITVANDIFLGANGGKALCGWSKTLKLTGSIADMDGASGKLTVLQDSGTLLFAQAAGETLSYTGGTVINSGGKAAINVDTVFPSVGNVTVNGSLNLYGHHATISNLAGSGTITTSGTSTLTLGTGQAAGVKSTYSGIFTQGEGASLSLVKEGAGTLVLNGTGANNSKMTVKSGNVELGKTAEGVSSVTSLTLETGTESEHVSVKITGASEKQVSGTVTLGDYAVFDLNGVSQNVGGLKSAGIGTSQDTFKASTNTHSVVTNTSASAATLTVGGGGELVFDGKITGNLSVILNNAGYFYLNNTANDFTGTLTVMSGTTLICGPGAMSSTLILDGGMLHNGNRTPNYTCAVQLGENGGKVMAGWSRNITLSGVISDVTGKNGKLTVVGDSGTVILTKENTYTGGTFLTKGNSGSAKIQMNADNALPTGGSVVFGANYINTGTQLPVLNTLNLNGHSASIGALATETGITDAAINNGSGTASALKIGYGITDASSVSTFSGHFTGTGTINLEKVGSGTQIFNGTAASSNTNLTVTEGILELANTLSSGSAVNNVTIQGGTLRLSGNVTDTGKLFGGTLSMTSGTLDAYGKNLSVGKTVTGGTLGNMNTVQKSVYTITAEAQTFAGGFSGNSEIHITGASDIILTGSSPGFTGDIYLENGAHFVYTGNAAVYGNGTIHLNSYLINYSNDPVINNNIILSGTNNNLRVGYGTGRVMTLNGVISGDYALNMNTSESNAGIITLNGANTYTGGTNLNGTSGTNPAVYRLGNDAALGSGTLNVHQNSNITLNASSSARTISNAISVDSGKTLTLLRSGTNAAVVSGDLSGSGKIVISSGVTLAGTGSIGSLTFEDASTYQMNLNELLAAGKTDGITVTDALTLNGGVTFAFVADDLQALNGVTFRYLNAEGTSLPENWYENVVFDFSKAGGEEVWRNILTSTNGVLSIDSGAIPEPSAFVLLLLGVGACGCVSRRVAGISVSRKGESR